MADPRKLRVLFFVEGYTDIRFVVGLSEICDLTMAVPARAYEESASRLASTSGAQLQVHEIPGGRMAFQLRPWRISGAWRRIRCRAVAGDAARLIERDPRRRPSRRAGRDDMGIAPLEYFRCRRERKPDGTGSGVGG